VLSAQPDRCVERPVIDPAGGVSDHPRPGDEPDPERRSPGRRDGDGPAPVDGFPPDHDAPGSRWWRIPMALAFAAFAAFWVWALFFASKEAVNKIGDREWAARAEQICVAAEVERVALADPTRFDPNDPDNRDQVLRLADNLDTATDLLEEMLNEVVSVAPNDPKGADIVPRWESEYRTYLRDRRTFTADLREDNIRPFSETAVDGVPISERLATFAGDNEMPSCSPPYDMPT
jgi:hypothetical protein